AAFVVDRDLMNLALVAGVAQAGSELEILRERYRHLAENCVAGVGAVLQERRIATEARRRDRQRGIHDEAFVALNVFLHEVNTGNPIDVRAVRRDNAELLADLVRLFAGSVVNREREARERQTAEVIAP